MALVDLGAHRSQGWSGAAEGPTWCHRQRARGGFDDRTGMECASSARFMPRRTRLNGVSPVSITPIWCGRGKLAKEEAKAQIRALAADEMSQRCVRRECGSSVLAIPKILRPV